MSQREYMTERPFRVNIDKIVVSKLKVDNQFDKNQFIESLVVVEKKINNSGKMARKRAIKLLKSTFPQYVYYVDDNGTVTLKYDKMLNAYKGNRIPKRFLKRLYTIAGEPFDFYHRAHVTKAKYPTWLLQCDTVRANLEPYSESIIRDLNQGHWEVFEEAFHSSEDITANVNTTNCLIARSPQLDIKETGVCAIDFGTKSTVVVCRNQEERLLRIGTGEYTRAPQKEDYENPTAIFFEDIHSFMCDYRNRIGRPYTEWSDVMVSHQASEKLYDKMDDNEVYYAIFSELKQWANDRKRHQLLQDMMGNEIELQPFMSLTDDDVDPIKLYAYYLGLYINNQRNGIYMSYILSFPVNYSVEVQERIIASFTKGLKKSLPPSILENEELMEDFEVYAGASEPAAYAISALERYGLEPQKENQEVAYGVFDFGGGTTDFDFGVEIKPADGRRKFEIHQFGKGGDPYLGGENLLQMLAYRVYVDNLDTMRSEGFQIVLPPKCSPLAGCETLIFAPDDAPQEAYLNMRVLMQTLRPFWEEEENYGDKYSSGTSVGLYRRTNNKLNLVHESLRIDVDELRHVLEEQIGKGIDSFIMQMEAAFKAHPVKSRPIHIFLAGNSCQSTILQRLFITKIINEIQTAQANRGMDNDVTNRYKLYAPLGTAIDIDRVFDETLGQEYRDLVQKIVCYDEHQTSDMTMIDQLRTGKTGVVFGLLRSRQGGKDVRIINKNITKEKEITFPYLLGTEGKERKFHCLIPTSVGYQQWEKFGYADEKKFELYYTSDIRGTNNAVPIEEVKCVSCRIDPHDVDEDAFVYIRKVAIDTIEYVVGGRDFTGRVEGKKIYKKELPN